MKTYKVVPYANTVVIEKKANPQEAIVKYFDVINQECVDGWEFVTVVTVPVTKKLGGRKTKVEPYNAFLFAKEE
ncbi:MAG: DUF4177 domain-containing protein [Clostridia bacterium]|nr:DUF4177 domain-containing protein [Clostridia bacterium]